MNPEILDAISRMSFVDFMAGCCFASIPFIGAWCLVQWNNPSSKKAVSK